MERFLGFLAIGNLSSAHPHGAGLFFGRVAQLERASAFEAEGCRFEPCRSRQQKKKCPGGRWSRNRWPAMWGTRGRQ